MINLIWAMDKNWLVGKDNQIPWHYKEDLLYYKEKTKGKRVLMGLNTYLSLKTYYKDKPLPYGTVFVADIDAGFVEGAITIYDVEKFLANTDKDEELWVVGGATIYNLALPYADRLYITHINKEYEGNIYFKKFNLDEDFKKTSSRTSGDLEFAIYERK